MPTIPLVVKMFSLKSVTHKFFRLGISALLGATLVLSGCGGGGGGGNTSPKSSDTQTITAAQLYSKFAVGNTWSYEYAGYPHYQFATVTNYFKGVAGVEFGYVTNFNFDASGAMIGTEGWGPYKTFTAFPGSASVGTTWTSYPAEYSSTAQTAKVVAFGVTRTVPAGTFSDCVQVQIDATNIQSSGQNIPYTITRYISPTVGGLVEEFNSLTGVTLKLEQGYIANPTDPTFNSPSSYPMPTITGFSPIRGASGTTVEIIGTNFALQPSWNNVWFSVDGGAPAKAKIISATTKSITVTVPPHAKSGPIIFSKNIPNYVASAESFDVPSIGPACVEKFGSSPSIKTTCYTNLDPFTQYCGSPGTQPGKTGVGQYQSGTANYEMTDCPGSYDKVFNLGTLLADVNSLHFISPSVNTASAPQFVTLTNYADTPITISNIYFSGVLGQSFVQSNDCGSVLTSGARCTVGVTFTPTVAPTVTSVVAALVIATPTYTKSVNISVAPALVPKLIVGNGMGSNVNFGPRLLGGIFLPAPVVLTNIGSATLNISNVVRTGSNDFSYTSTCGATLAAGAQCYLTVNFIPTSNASYVYGLITVSSDSIGGPTEITLSGYGITSAPTPAPVLIPIQVPPSSQSGTATPTPLSGKGKAAFWTRHPMGISAVFSTNDDHFAIGKGRDTPPTACVEEFSVKVREYPVGQHTYSFADRAVVFSTASYAFTIHEGGCTIIEISGTTMCTYPKVLQNGWCQTPIPYCSFNQVVQNGVCVTPSPSAGAGSSSGTAPDADGCYTPPPGCVTATPSTNYFGFKVTYKNNCQGGVYIGAANQLSDLSWSGGSFFIKAGQSDYWDSGNGNGYYAYHYTGSPSSAMSWVCAGKVPGWSTWQP